MSCRAMGLLALVIPLCGCNSSESNSNAPGSGGSAGAGATTGGGSGAAQTTSADAATGGAPIGDDAAIADVAARISQDAPTSMHPQNPRLAAIAAGSALDLGRYTCPSPDGEDPADCRNMTDYSGFAYDPRNHQMIAFGGGHATTMIDSVLMLDLGGDLTWKSAYDPTPCSMMTTANLDSALGAWKTGTSGPYPRPVSAHTYDFHGVAIDQNEFVLLGRLYTGGSCSSAGNDIGGPIAHFDLAKHTWSFSSDATSSKFDDNMPGMALDPMTKKFISLGTGGLQFYDPATRTTQHFGSTLLSVSGKVVSFDSLGYANHMVYFPPDDTFYYFVRGMPVLTYALKLNRAAPEQSTLDMVQAGGNMSPHQEPAYDYDSTNQVIGGGVFQGLFFVFDPRIKAWSAKVIPGTNVGTEAFHALRYDPVDNVFIFVTDATSGQHTWAFRYK